MEGARLRRYLGAVKVGYGFCRAYVLALLCTGVKEGEQCGCHEQREDEREGSFHCFIPFIKTEYRVMQKDRGEKLRSFNK